MTGSPKGDGPIKMPSNGIGVISKLGQLTDPPLPSPKMAFLHPYKREEVI